MATPLTGGTISAQRPSYQPYPCGVPKSMAFEPDFSASDEFVLDLNNAIELKNIDAVEGLYVNNFGNAARVDFTFNGTGQVISVPAGAQGYFPVLVTNPPKITIASTGNVKIQFQLTNFPVPCQVWTP